MICLRCQKDLGHADNKNADYIVAEDTQSEDTREVFIAYRENDTVREKASKDELISDEDYDQEEIISPVEAVGAAMVKSIVKSVTVQKTGLVCPDCYRSGDFVIWGIHKEV